MHACCNRCSFSLRNLALSRRLLLVFNFLSPHYLIWFHGKWTTVVQPWKTGRYALLCLIPSSLLLKLCSGPFTIPFVMVVMHLRTPHHYPHNKIRYLLGHQSSKKSPFIINWFQWLLNIVNRTPTNSFLDFHNHKTTARSHSDMYTPILKRFFRLRVTWTQCM